MTLDEIISFFKQYGIKIYFHFVALMGISLIATAADVFFQHRTDVNMGSILFWGLIGLYLLSYFILSYLKTDPSSNIRSTNYSYDTELLRLAIEKLSVEFKTLAIQFETAERMTSIWSESEREQVVNTLNESLSQTLSTEFMNSVEDKYGAKIAEREYHSKLRQIFGDSKNRVLSEIEALTRRSNINLVIGIITTLLAVSLLAYVVLSDKINATDFGSVLLHFLPRLSLVIFVELFSYFFLQLYKTGLADIKYYQNELTDIESRHIALEATTGFGITESAESILTIFAKTDRNNGVESTHPKGSKQNVSIKDIEGLVGKISDLVSKTSK